MIGAAENVALELVIIRLKTQETRIKGYGYQHMHFNMIASGLKG